MLAIWWVPLSWNIVLRLLAVVFAIGLLALAPFTKHGIVLGTRALGFVALTILEITLLVTAFSYAGGGLLSEAMAPHSP